MRSTMACPEPSHGLQRPAGRAHLGVLAEVAVLAVPRRRRRRAPPLLLLALRGGGAAAAVRVSPASYQYASLRNRRLDELPLT